MASLCLHFKLNCLSSHSWQLVSFGHVRLCRLTCQTSQAFLHCLTHDLYIMSRSGSLSDEYSSVQAELRAAVQAGACPGKDIVFANACKRPRDIRAAASMGVNLTTFDTPCEIQKLAQHHPGTAALLRIRADDPDARSVTIPPLQGPAGPAPASCLIPSLAFAFCVVART